MERLFACSLLPFVAALAMAQTMTCTTLTGGVVQAVNGSVTLADAIPPGTTAPHGHHVAHLTGLFTWARASVTWHTTAGPDELRFQLMHQLMAAGGAAASGAPGDFLLEVVAPAAMPLQFVTWREAVLVAGMPVPTVLVDIGDDGNVELTSGTPVGVEVAAILPAGSTRIRVRVAASLTSGMAAHVLHACVRPAHTAVQDLGYGCDPPGLGVVPQFSGAIALRHDGNALAMPWLVVLGVGLSPTQLPSPWPLCLLLPTPDVVLFAPGAVEHTLMIPAALRPFTCFAQSVRLSPLGPASGSAFRIDAH